jgi:flagellar hook-basal body complex protein FliE
MVKVSMEKQRAQFTKDDIAQAQAPANAVKLRVPDELLAQLHAANQKFHEAKQRLEQTMAETQEDHLHRVADQMQKFRQAEAEMEEISRKIKADYTSKETSAPPSKS